MSSGDRPNPDALLALAQREERAHSGKGTLRIYLGAFAGVGKTYAMLNEAQRRKSYGEDVVIGYVETHGRAGTAAMAAGLDLIPRKRVAYRGVAIEEMDVDAILRRRPRVCLVDELAHTNAPGSEREKRYEDVEVLRDARINVVSTLNVQHLESLNDTVESLTGVKVRETIPDSVVDDADELILIDLSPQAARARMEHGHIYPPAQAHAALQSFFRPDNLATLREIALRRTAQEVDTQLDGYMREASERRPDVTDHVLVLVDADPFARVLVRRGWRLAQALHGDLIVLHATQEAGSPAQSEILRTIELAEDLNARVITIAGEVEQRLAPVIAAEGVNHIVLAHRRRGALRRLRAPSLAARLLETVPDLEVHLVAVTR